MMVHTVSSHAEIVVACANQLGESPLWCPSEGVLWWLDIGRPALYRLGPCGSVDQWPLPKPAGCLTLRKEGGLLLAFRSGIALLDAPGGEPRWVDVEGLTLGDDRFNDGKCDRAGRFWLATLDRRMQDAIGVLYRFDKPGRCFPMDKGFALSNGIGWSPDNRTLYFADTVSRSIYAYDYDLAAGEISRRRLFAQSSVGPGGPDGLTVDAEGGVWSAQFGRGCLHRYDPDGGLERTVELPVSQPTSVMFGGPLLDTLYITSATVGLDAQQLHREPMAGALLSVQPGVKGMPEARFASADAAHRSQTEFVHG
jgi:L-arabinonolactonase